MRILYISDNVSEHNHRFLAKLSAEERNEIFFLNISSAVAQESWTPKRVKILPHPSSLSSIAPDSMASIVPELQSLLATTRPDIVHAGPIQTCGYLAALSDFHPLVVMSWGSDLLLDLHRGPEWENATNIALRHSDGFVCDCDTVRHAACRYAQLPEHRIAQFPWGIIPGSFCPEGPILSHSEYSFGSNDIPVICTRSWEPVYRIGMLLEAFQRAHQADRRLRLLLIGDGSERERVRSFLTRNSLHDVVLTPGKVQNSELPKWFRVAKAYVSCAESDGTSVSLLEAMATGLPVIVTDIPSNHEWVTPDENGWLASTTEGFARHLEGVGRLTRAQRDSISVKNRTLIAEKADWNRNFPKLLRLYRSLLCSSETVLA